MIRSVKRWLVGIASAGLMALSLPSVATTAALAAPQQSGPFWPGNLLSMDNADFENGVGNWNAVSGVKTLTTDATAYLHNSALKVVATGTSPITSVLQLSGTSGIEIPVNPGGKSDTYRVGAYVQMGTENSHTTEFDLGCYDSSGHWLGWYDGRQVSNNSTGAWQWVEDDITLPSACTHVQGSPRVQFTGMHDGGTIHMDEVWFAPDRAALMIGAYAPSSGSWNTDNAAIGPLQSVKEFFGGGSPDLPGQWQDSTNRCWEIMQPQNPPPPSVPPVCVINLNPQDNSGNNTVYSEHGIHAFFKGMPTDQTVIMVYHGEAESSHFSGCLGPGTTDAANFICYFKREASNIRAAAAAYPALKENVFIADDSTSSQYDASGTGMSPTRCGWIVQPSYVDFYLEDHYERGWADGSNLSVQKGNGDPNYNGKGAPQWNNWLGCVEANDKPIGLAEYGLCSGGADCNKGSTSCGDAGSTTDDTKTLAADNSYLSGEPSGTSPTLLWEYWYDKCWQFTDSSGISKWQSIENQNGGAVGG